MSKRKVCIVTGTRAEWGLLQPIAAELKRRGDVELQIVATNMHLNPLYGMTVNQIERDGFRVDERVAMPADTVDGRSTARAMGVCMQGMADAFSRLEPDLVVILGDRYEMLAVASTATVMRIPIVHLHGGEITLGAMDDAIRHAITEMAALHLVSTDDHRRRVVQLGQQPDRVITTGAIGVYQTLNVPRMPLSEIRDSLGFDVDAQTLLVTYHPATMDPRPAEELFGQLLEALDRLPDCRVIFTYPNNDPQGQGLIRQLQAWVERNSSRAMAIPSLGQRRYLSILPYIGAVVGNSSSGIIEVPSAGIPTVNIGIRQLGRTQAASVVNCDDNAGDIERSIRLALSPEFRRKAATAVNPYYRPDSLSLIVGAIADTPLESLRNKTFYDIQ